MFGICLFSNKENNIKGCNPFDSNLSNTNLITRFLFTETEWDCFFFFFIYDESNTFFIYIFGTRKCLVLHK
jgi:hypothetical protein